MSTNLVPIAAQVVPDDPYAQVVDTLGIMRGYVLADMGSPAIQADAAQLPSTVDPVVAVFDHVQARMRFVRDEETATPFQDQYPYPIVEILIRPRDIATQPYPRGDCDDFTMYGAALLLAKGVPCAFVTVAADPRTPDDYSHVYLAAYPTEGAYAGARVPLDLSHGSYPGWETDQVIGGKRTEWPLTQTAGGIGTGHGGAFELLKLGLLGWGVWKFVSGPKGAIRI